MFETLEAYEAAISAQGVVETDYAELNKVYKDFDKRSKTAFNKYMEGRNLSTYVFDARRRIPTYVNPDSQAMWCSWSQVLMHMPSFREWPARDRNAEIGLFRVYLRTCGFEDYEAFDGTSPMQIMMLKWEAWNEAIEFGYTL